MPGTTTTPMLASPARRYGWIRFDATSARSLDDAVQRRSHGIASNGVGELVERVHVDIRGGQDHLCKARRRRPWNAIERFQQRLVADTVRDEMNARRAGCAGGVLEKPAEVGDRPVVVLDVHRIPGGRQGRDRRPAVENRRAVQREVVRDLRPS